MAANFHYDEEICAYLQEMNISKYRTPVFTKSTTAPSKPDPFRVRHRLRMMQLDEAILLDGLCEATYIETMSFEDTGTNARHCPDISNNAYIDNDVSLADVMSISHVCEATVLDMQTPPYPEGKYKNPSWMGYVVPATYSVSDMMRPYAGKVLPSVNAFIIIKNFILPKVHTDYKGRRNS